MKKGYCEKCDKIVKYNLVEKKDYAEIKGKEYEYISLIGVCDNCGEQVSDTDLVDKNLKRIDCVYRKAEGIITQNEILDILKKYKIGKKPLSKLLGWGEVTLTRYINGDVPTKMYSDELYKLLNNKKNMIELLEKNKENITQKAYKQVKSALNDQTTISNIEIVAQYIIEKGQEITPLALQKLLYYVQGFAKVFLGEFLFEEECEAWVHGPVYTRIYNKYREFGSGNIEQDVDYNIEELMNEDTKNLIDVIVNSFGYYNGKALEMMTHYEQPWVNARKNMPINEKSNNIISKEDIKEYFEKIKEKYEMINILEIKKYSQEQFELVLK